MRKDEVTSKERERKKGEKREEKRTKERRQDKKAQRKHTMRNISSRNCKRRRTLRGKEKGAAIEEAGNQRGHFQRKRVFQEGIPIGSSDTERSSKTRI